VTTDNLLHKLWTKAVGTPDYVKSEWTDFDARIARLGVALRDLLAVVANDDLIPESVSYMKQARAAIQEWR
jgi:hypothetical protein